jgi:hypothetical protein
LSSPKAPATAEVTARRSGSGADGSTLTLAQLEGRLPDRRDGRPRRNHKVAFQLRKRFMEVLDDTGRKIMVYVDENGGVRRDVSVVQDELEAAGEFRGIQDQWHVDVDEVMAEDVDHKELLAVTEGKTGKKRKRMHNEDEFDNEEDSDPEDEEEAGTGSNEESDYDPDKESESEDGDEDDEPMTDDLGTDQESVKTESEDDDEWSDE